MKNIAVLSSLFVVIFLAIGAGSTVPVSAQGNPPAPGKPQAEVGPNAGEAVVSWERVPEARFYILAWISQEDFQMANETGEEWRDFLTYKSVRNTGQASQTVTGLKSGYTYWFAVGSSAQRFGSPAWSPWSNALMLDTCSGDRDALVALYEATNGDRWQNNLKLAHR